MIHVIGVVQGPADYRSFSISFIKILVSFIKYTRYRNSELLYLKSEVEAWRFLPEIQIGVLYRVYAMMVVVRDHHTHPVGRSRTGPRPAVVSTSHHPKMACVCLVRYRCTPFIRSTYTLSTYIPQLQRQSVRKPIADTSRVPFSSEELTPSQERPSVIRDSQR